MNIRAAIVSLMLGTLTVSCQNVLVPASDPGYPAMSIAETETRLITSSVNGRTYEISIAFPGNYNEADSPYPILFVLDANHHFGTFVETARSLAAGSFSEPIIVGVGYPVGRYINSFGTRAVDLTPSSDQEAIAAYNKDNLEMEALDKQLTKFPAMEGSGGGPDFLSFMLEELIPLIEAEYKASPNGRGLVGWSFSGLFALYAMFETEGVFERFIIVSPFLKWDEHMIFDMEKEYAETHTLLSARIFLTVGALEGDESIADHHKFYEALRAREYDGLSQRLFVADEETHMSVVPATIGKGLRFIYGGEKR